MPAVIASNKTEIRKLAGGGRKKVIAWMNITLITTAHKVRGNII